MRLAINGFDTASIQSAINTLNQYVQTTVPTLCMAIAQHGVGVARPIFDSATYDGTNDVTVQAQQTSNGAAVHASGNAVLFIEYGAGAIYPNYPGVDPYGRGSWSMGPNGKGHWNDPNGWYYAHGKKSWGNPPAAAMFHAEQSMNNNAQRIAKTVLK